ncbi:MAG: hypothetical protein GX931_00020 [Acholeplasmataceae bacterium]|nr:hypothetical protein [Acholeplasmataceae bacterium]
MITINKMAQILGVSDLTIRRAIKEEKLSADKLDNGTYQIQDYEALRYISENPKYSNLKLVLLEEIKREEGLIEEKEVENHNDIEMLNAKIATNSVRIAGKYMIEAFNEHLDDTQNLSLLPSTFRKIENKLDVTKQPTIDGIVNILDKVVSVKTHNVINVGDVLSGDEIQDVFGRKPQQEGINFCTETKELYVITKLGSNNPTVEFAEYNDYWKLGKIYYEGKGQNIQEFKGSNLHLHRKYLVYNRQIKCKEGVPSYIHVFNKISNDESKKFQYIGIFDVTDFMINEHSAGISQETKTAIVFELTPRVDNKSNIIDDNYIF